MRFGPILAVVPLLLATIAHADSPIPERRLSLIRDTDFPGGDIRTIFDSTLNACETACLSDDSCVAFTYNGRSRACFPKSAITDRQPYQGAMSARKVAMFC